MGVEVASQAAATLVAAISAAFPVEVTFPVVDFAQPRMPSGARALVAEASVD
jgi:hypothetical protein